MSIFRFVDEPDADRDEIAAERWTLGLLGGYLKEMYPPQEPAWPGMIGSMTGFPLVVDDNLPMCEVRVRRRPPVDLGDLAAMIREFTVTAPVPTGAAADWCACTIFKQGADWHVSGCPRAETTGEQR